MVTSVSERVALRARATVEAGEFTLDVDIVATAGEVVALLGPNGAGKSTLLRAVAGLVAIDAGRIELEGVVLDDPARSVFVPPEDRAIGVVFQDHRLFPHLRVLDNVAFGLRSRGSDRRAARATAQGWLERLDLDELGRRYPRQLSGGEAQRVALARALAIAPRALLLDEPLAALDVQTRAAVQGELRQHLRDYAGPTVLVTHDPIEALLLADRIVVLEHGRVVQEGSAALITSRPATPYVARLVGVNLFPGLARGGLVTLAGGDTVLAPETADGRVLTVIRPSAFTVHLDMPHHSSARNVWHGTIMALAPLADRIRLEVRGRETVLVDVTPAAVAELQLHPGTSVWLAAKSTDLVIYPASER